MALMAVEDCATMLYRAASNSKTFGRMFVASSNENPMTWEIAEAIAASTKVPFRAIGLPKPGIAIGRAVLGRWWQSAYVPHALQVAAWRANLLLDGLYCDGSEVIELLNLRCQNWREGFARMYQEYPRKIDRAVRP
jgi:nucleoside-diphosphate-sugar epimerase